jgi:hypothetical protein
MDATKSGETLADDDNMKSDLLNLVEKLRMELQTKDEELANEKQENQVCKAFYCFQSKLVLY